MTNPFSTEWAWLKGHEKLLIILAIVGTILIGHYKFINYLSDRDKRRDDTAHAVLQQQVLQNQQLAAQAQTDADNYKQLLAQITPQIAQLQASINNRNVAVVAQQRTDAALPSDQLASRIVSLAPGGSVVVTPNGNYDLDHPEAVAVAQKLELVAPLQQNVTDQLQIIGDKDKLIGGLNTSVTDLNKQVGGLNQQLVDKDKACIQDIKTAVDNEKKNQRKWYAVFYILGLATKAVLLGRP